MRGALALVVALAWGALLVGRLGQWWPKPARGAAPEPPLEPAPALPPDIRAMLTTLATSPADHPTSAQRARLGEWLGLPLCRLPRRGRPGAGQR